MQPPPRVVLLITLNLVVQIFDGIATYVGAPRFGEANPLLRAGFAAWGAGPTLLLAKLSAAALILMLARADRPTLVSVGLSFTLVAYVSLSLIPWMYRLLS